jgi:transposase
VVYRGILEKHLLPFTQGLFQNNFRFQHDNAPAHTSRVVQTFLQEHDIDTLPQPSVSPDTNPIEHLWDELGRAVRNRDIPPTNLQQLGQSLVEEWDRIPLNRLVTLVESMPRRLADIIGARGGHTRYNVDSDT